MTVIESLLEYQKVDTELRKVEQELSSSEERKRAVQARNAVKNAERKIEDEDARAAEIVRLRDEIAARVEQAGKTLAEYEDVDELVAEGGGDIAFYKRSAQQLAENLRSAKNDLARILAEAENLSKEYVRIMKQGREMMAVYKESSEKFNELQNSRAAEQNEIKARLAVIAKNIPPELMERYLQKRNERIFPVIVPLAGDTCVCGMDLALAQRGKLTDGNIIECENCHRLIYKR